MSVRLLVATRKTQGTRASDFSHAVEGELVRLTSQCSRDRETIDGECGCRRSFTGVRSNKATTTVMVAERPDEEAALLIDAHTALGLDPDDALDAVEDLLDLAACSEVGAVLERRGDVILQRTPRSASLGDDREVGVPVQYWA